MNLLGLILGGMWIIGFIVMMIIVIHDLHYSNIIDSYMSDIKDKVDAIIDVALLDLSLSSEYSVDNRVEFVAYIVKASIKDEKHLHSFDDKYGVELKYIIYNKVISHPHCSIKLYKKDYMSGCND